METTNETINLSDATDRLVTEPADTLISSVREGINQRISALAAQQLADDGATDTILQGLLTARIASTLDALDTSRNAETVIDLRPTMATQALALEADFFDTRLPGEDLLSSLLDATSTLTSAATVADDGRQLSTVLGIVQDTAGATRRGIEVRLLDASKQLIDRTRTDDGGLFLLVIPTGNSSAGNPISVTLDVVNATLVGTLDLTAVPAASQSTVVTAVVSALPALPLDLTGKPFTPLGDDPLSRLPADFTPELADALVRLRGNTVDPILGAAANAGDFRQQRSPLVKSVVVNRTGPDGTKYLVTLRQQWVFLGYTLGQLASVSSLDPGQIVSTVAQQLEHTVSSTAQTVDRATTLATSLTRNLLTQLSSIDTLVDVAAQLQTGTGISAGVGVSVAHPIEGLIGAIVGGVVAGPLGAIAGGILGGGVGIGASTNAGVSTLSDTKTSTATNTSLLVNSTLQTAASTINTAITTASQLLDDLEKQVSDVTNDINPLLSRVTNLIRWTMYENYAVVSRIEDVLQVTPVPLNLPTPGFPARATGVTRPAPGSVELRPGGGIGGIGGIGGGVDQLPQPVPPTFSDEDIVEYRRWFQPALLDPTLAPQFDVLKRDVAASLGGGIPITTIYLDIDYSAVLADGQLRINIGDIDETVVLSQSSASLRTTIIIPPTQAGELDAMHLTLSHHFSAFEQFAASSPFEALFPQSSVKISKIRLWFNHTSAGPAEQTFTDAVIGSTTTDYLHVTASNPTSTQDITLVVPASDTAVPTQNPLFRHVNRNRTYYMDVLLEAGLRIPSLRADSPQLAGLDSRIWQLPIVGFDGGNVLVLQDITTAADGTTPGYPDILTADDGAATVVQLAAPGSYSEALQGLLSLTDAAGKLYPNLVPPTPVLPPIALVNTATQTVTPITQVGSLGDITDAPTSGLPSLPTPLPL